MKCLACGYENIYGSTVCKQCGADLKAKPIEAQSSPVAVQETQSVTIASITHESSPRVESQKQTAYPNELTFIPYIGNEQFNHFIRVLRRAFDFQGRSTRSEFWWFTLFQIIISLVILLILPFLSPIFSLLLLIPAIAVSIRRLHDINKPGWWLLLIFIPLVGGLVLLIFFVMASYQAANQWGAVSAN